ncbi:BTB/POZ domain-containing protein 2-like [Folsomia candida]|uniref:BTB/POZ domain-containing protein 2-like n=1 Tax=Folsomia candida TaxID=158441 RepID=UPI00160511B1|nr:BTB/POZ domain-containing protein 2-like [Folsomia candida]
MSDISGTMVKSEIPSEMLSKPEFDWNGSHYDRELNLFLTGYQSDLILHLGSEGLKIPVHRIFLQAGSPVLNEMLKRTAADLIIKDDVDIRIFRMLLRYLYTGKSDVEMGDALQLMQLATKYQVQCLRDHCATVLEGDLTLENVLPLFQSGMEYAHGDFIQSTLKFICTNARKILKSDHFTTLRLDCLIEVIQQDSLQVRNEIEVFEAVYRWGQAECTRLSLDFKNSENLRKCLAKPLTHIRFPLMSHKDFALKVASKKLLNVEETMELLTSFLLPVDERNMLPPGKFMSNPRLYLTNYIGARVTVSRNLAGVARLVRNMTGTPGNTNGSETIV